VLEAVVVLLLVVLMGLLVEEVQVVLVRLQKLMQVQLQEVEAAAVVFLQRPQ
jgi:hypothetical protein